MKKHLIAMLAMGAAASPSYAAEILIPDDVATLELALNPAVSEIVPGDTIVLRGGLYTGTFNVGIQDIMIRPFAGDTVTIDSSSTGSVFTCGPAGSGLVLEDLTISGGGASQGGGIFANTTSVTIRRCTFRNHEATNDGGAIYANASTLVIEDSLFENNTLALPNTVDDGGAIFAQLGADITIAGTTFRNNHANARGGAIAVFTGAVLTVTDCFFEMNTSSQDGGAILAVTGTDVVISGTTFRNNETSIRGGAVAIFDNTALMMASCLFETNECQFDGGAIAFFAGSRGAVTDTILQGNTAGNTGGGIYCNSSWPDFIRCTFTENQALGNGGGAAALQGETAEEVEFFDCLLYNNTAQVNGGALLTRAGPDPRMYSCTIVGNQIVDTAFGNGGGIWETDGATATSLYNCILRDNVPTQYPVIRTNIAFYCNISGGELSGNTAIIDQDPMFVDAAGGDFRLMPGSPSIDAGDITLFFDDVTPIDLDGNDRCVTDPDTLAMGGGTGVGSMRLYTDHGAYEFQPDLSCTSDCVGDTTTTGATLDGQPGFGEPDGVIDLDDLGFFLGQWLAGCP
ncbi:MAG: right-handed parallel beta-helix repeat-containing protein [Planctomycetota bacterium]